MNVRIITALSAMALAVSVACWAAPPCAFARNNPYQHGSCFGDPPCMDRASNGNCLIDSGSNTACSVGGPYNMSYHTYTNNCALAGVCIASPPTNTPVKVAFPHGSCTPESGGP